MLSPLVRTMNSIAYVPSSAIVKVPVDSATEIKGLVALKVPVAPWNIS